MKTPAWLISIIACLVAFTGSAAAQCTRHFYNNSVTPFKVEMDQGLCNKSTTCIINPGETGTLFYYGLLQGGITVTSTFYHSAFTVSACHIFHGDTGAIAVNDPAEGDVTTCGGSGWDCPAVPCNGNFYNNTNVPFEVSLTAGSCNADTACTVPPGGVGFLIYNGSVRHSSLKASSSTFSTSVPVLACGVMAPNSDRMQFNVPNGGDVTTCGGPGFPCPTSAALKHTVSRSRARRWRPPSSPAAAR
jgi:hypothetical protein